MIKPEEKENRSSNELRRSQLSDKKSHPKPIPVNVEMTINQCLLVILLGTTIDEVKSALDRITSLMNDNDTLTRKCLIDMNAIPTLITALTVPDLMDQVSSLLIEFTPHGDMLSQVIDVMLEENVFRCYVAALEKGQGVAFTDMVMML